MAWTAILKIAAKTQFADMATIGVLTVSTVVQPIAFLLISIAVISDESPAAMGRVVIGVVLASTWSATVWSSSGILRKERLEGTLARTLTGVINPLKVIFAKGLVASTLSVAAITLAVILTALAGNLTIAVAPVSILVISGLLTVLSATAMSLMLGAIFVGSRYGNRIAALVTYPVIVLSGVLTPQVNLVPGLSIFTNVISLSWIARISDQNNLPSNSFIYIGIAIALSAIYAYFGVIFFRRMVRRAMRDGTLDFD